jgi:hypothetical protein
MAVQPVTKTQVLTDLHGTLDAIAGYNLQWAAMANGDTGASVALPGAVDRTIQATGNFGAGGSVTLEGSNDGVNYFSLSNPGGAAIALTAAGGSVALGAVQSFRPRVTAGDGTTAIVVTVFTRNTQNKF